MLSFFVLDSAAEQSPVNQQVPGEPGDEDPDDAETLAVFFRHYWDSAPCSYPDRTGDLDSIVLVSDCYSLRQFRSSGMWSEYLRPYRVARELVGCIGGVPGRTSG